MATLRPYHYTGGTLYATMSTSSGKGNALFYDGYYNQCGWVSIFYNNTGKDIVIKSAKAMVGVWSGSCTCRLICKILGTSVPDSFTGGTNLGEKTIKYPGKTIVSYTNWSDLSLTVPKGNYFAIGVQTVNANSNQYFCMARTGVTTGSGRVNKYNIFYRENSGAWKRDYSDPWKYQVPEIYVEYKLASIPVYINGGINKSDTFYQGNVRYYDLSGYSKPSIASISSPHIGAKIINNTLCVWANLLDFDVNADVVVSGYGSTATLKVIAKKSSINSITASKYTLKPGQTATFKYTYTGSADNSDTNAYGVYGEAIEHGANGRLKGWCVDYDLLRLQYNNETYYSDSPRKQLIPDYIKFTHTHSPNAGTISLGALTDKNMVIGKDITITAQVWTSYHGGAVENSDIIGSKSVTNAALRFGHYVNNTSKSMKINLQHWTVNDLYVVKSADNLLYGEDNFITITNLTNLTGVDSNKRNEFNKVKLSIPKQYKDYLKFFNFNPVAGCSISEDGQECILGNSSYVGLRCTSPNGFTEPIISDLFGTVKLNLTLVNDAIVETTLNFELGQQYEFKVIYPLNNITDNPNSDKTGADANPLYSGSGLEFTTKAKLPIYRTGAAAGMYMMSVFNYPIQIQIPSVLNEDYVNQNGKDFELSLGQGTVTIHNSISDETTEVQVYNILPYLSDTDKYAKANEERIIMVNCPEKIDCSNLANRNLAKFTEFNSASGPITKAEYYDLTLAEGLNYGINSIKFKFKTINANCNLKLLLFKSDSEFKVLYSKTIENSDVVSIDETIIISEDDINTYGNKLVLRAPEYLDGKPKLILISVSDAQVVSKSRDSISGLPLGIPVTMTLPIKIRRINDNGKLDKGNNSAVNYKSGGATHRINFTLNLFNECDLSDRSGEHIKFLGRKYMDGTVSEDLTIQRTICDAQRITHMYGRFTDDPTITVDADGYYTDDFTAIDDYFVDYKDTNNKNYTGKLITNSQDYLKSLLLGMNQLISSIQNAALNTASDEPNASQVRCLSNIDLVNKLNKPRSDILSNYPIMWDDSTLFNSNTGEPTEKYNTALFKNIYSDVPEEDVVKCVKDALANGTASPIHELMMCIASFQDSKPLADIVCECDGTDESDGKPHKHIIAVQGTHENDKNYIFDLGIIDF